MLYISATNQVAARYGRCFLLVASISIRHTEWCCTARGRAASSQSVCAQSAPCNGQSGSGWVLHACTFCALRWCMNESTTPTPTTFFRPPTTVSRLSSTSLPSPLLPPLCPSYRCCCCYYYHHHHHHQYYYLRPDLSEIGNFFDNGDENKCEESVKNTG